MNKLYYGDNLDILRKKLRDETVDLCYIDPPFNSKRNYNQIYNNVGDEDRAQAQAFIDTWVWDQRASEGYTEIIANDLGRFLPQVVALISGLHSVLGEGSLLAYLVSITLRVTEIHRVLKTTGSFYLHCDQTASHYIKLLLDAIFVASGGEFQNEIVWWYLWGGRGRTKWNSKHDTLLFYTKSSSWTFNFAQVLDDHQLVSSASQSRVKYKGALVHHRGDGDSGIGRDKVLPSDTWYIPTINAMAKERMGYPTQKPEALLERVIAASSNEGDVVLDAYCGCGTTVAVAQRMNRNWIGVDITFQSISLILRRLEGLYGQEVVQAVDINGLPRDTASARALALKKDDRVRKEFEKWAVLTYSNNRARINEKKGGDKGIDGVAFFLTGKTEQAKIVFQVKSGSVGRGDISKLNNDRTREGAELAVFITLEEPTKGMKQEATAAGFYMHQLMMRNYPRIEIVTVANILQEGARLNIPLSLEVLKAARSAAGTEEQMDLI